MRSHRFLVLGGGGFVGTHLVTALAASGAEVTVPVRRRERARHLLVLPTVEVVEGDAADPARLAGWTSGCDALINLVGVLHSRRGRRDERGPNDYGPDFARAHVEIAQAAVAACRAAGVRRLLHMSALGAAPDAPSEYLRSKGIGEQAVLAAEDLEVTAFRPSVIFGPEDRFLNLFARLATAFPLLAVPCPHARFQPVYVGDVVRAFLAALEDPGSFGQRYDLGGPKVYELIELVRAVCAMSGRRRVIVGLPDWASYLQARCMEWLPVPPMTRDNCRSMRLPSVCAGAALPFGLRPAALELLAPTWLVAARPRARYAQLRQRAHR
jgi:uncharacterized protein YbjT (DUF2867 family)